MSCKHEFVEAQGTKMDYEKNDNGRIETLIRRKVCWKCYKTKTEIDIEQQLAAANARIAAEREENIENAKNIVELTKMISYIGGIVEKGTGQSLLSDVPVTNQILDYVIGLEKAKERLKIYKDGLCLVAGEITDEYISEFLHSLPTGSIWHFIACKWDAKMLRLTSERQRAEQAEASCAAMRNCIKRLIYVIDSTPECFRAIDKTTEYLLAQDFADDVKTTAGAAILARMKRMREALERCGLCRDYSHEKVKCYHDYEGHRPPQATCDHPEAGFKLVDWAALEEKP